jgi:prepilin-type N-terminal cleavage/methylation domain-containing protein
MRNGFTLIEVLLSIALIGILIGIALPTYYILMSRNDLDVAKNQIVQSLRRAAVLSASSDGDTNWGVAIQSGSIVIFKGASYSSEIGHWKMNDNDSNTTVVVDSSSNSYNGTAQQNTSTLTVNPGKVNRALNFSNSSNYITAGTTVGTFGTGDFSVAFWLLTSASGIEYPLSKRSSCGCSNFWNFQVVSGKIGFEVSEDGCANYAYPATTSTYNDGNWHQVIGIRSGTSVSVYVDGSLQASASSKGTTDLNNSNTFMMGGTICLKSFSGQIDDVRVYTKALSSDEIADIYNGGTGTESDKVITPDTTRDTSYDETYQTSSAITPSGLTEIVFNKMTGLPKSTGTITLTSTNGETRTITINSEGQVSY